VNEPILLVEDDENDIFFMERGMKEAGITRRLQVVMDGQEAIDYLGGTGEYSDRDRFPLPCLILLDLKLPRVMGLEVLKWVRRQPELETIIVIIMSSSKLAPDIAMAYRLGANSYLVKCSGDKLSQMLVRVRQYWLELNQAPTPCLKLADLPQKQTTITTP
jgi:CheY-like chemotaxis protein